MKPLYYTEEELMYCYNHHCDENCQYYFIFDGEAFSFGHCKLIYKKAVIKKMKGETE